MWAIFAGATGWQRMVSGTRAQNEVPRNMVIFAESYGMLNKRCFVNHVFSCLTADGHSLVLDRRLTLHQSATHQRHCRTPEACASPGHYAPDGTLRCRRLLLPVHRTTHATSAQNLGG